MIDAVQQTLRAMAAAGWRGFDCTPATASLVKNWNAPEGLAQIRADLGQCKRCKLCQSRRTIVFGAGNPKARLVFVGEGPGAEEDRRGEPFVGEAGQLLTRIIGAITLTRDDVYICNVVKCRPPGNRNPEPDEIAACGPFLKRQLNAIGPEFICALGTFAAQTLLRTKDPVTRLRGRFFALGPARVLCTYHPAFLLRNPSKKADVWQDMKMLMRAMGIDPPGVRGERK
jgi:DNA polymerase